jgi:hypothetical protein
MWSAEGFLKIVNCEEIIEKLMVRMIEWFLVLKKLELKLLRNFKTGTVATSLYLYFARVHV